MRDSLQNITIVLEWSKEVHRVEEEEHSDTSHYTTMMTFTKIGIVASSMVRTLRIIMHIGSNKDLQMICQPSARTSRKASCKRSRISTSG